MKPFLVLAAAVASFAATITAEAADIQVRINGIRRPGVVLINLHNDPAGFPRDDNRAFAHGRVRATGSSASFTFRNVPPGVYAYTYLIDENGNGDLDTNGLGIPLEAVGFSQNPPIGLSPPSFQRASFHVDTRGATAPSTAKYFN